MPQPHYDYQRGYFDGLTRARAQRRPRVIARALTRGDSVPSVADEPTMRRHSLAIVDAINSEPPRVREALDMIGGIPPGAPRPPLVALAEAVLLPPSHAYRDHVGDDSPAPAGSLVAVDLGDGSAVVDRAGNLAWGPGLGPDGEGRIKRWAFVAEA